jgi:hypothetical protein
VPGEARELLAMLPWGVLAGFLGRLLLQLGQAVVDEVARPVLRAYGRRWAERIEAPPDSTRPRSKHRERPRRGDPSGPPVPPVGPRSRA